CLIASALLLLRLGGRDPRPVTVFAVCGGFAVALPIFAGLSGFSVIPFGTLVLLCVICWREAWDKRLAGAALALCLLRPDGVIFSIPLIIARLLYSNDRPRTFKAIFLGFILPGALYFAWRWHYFGHFLPLPFLVKSDAVRWHGLLVAQTAS